MVGSVLNSRLIAHPLGASQADVLAQRKGEVGVILEHCGRLVPQDVPVRLVQIDIAVEHPTLRRMEQTQQHLDERGLARAVGTDEGHALAGLDGE